LLDCFETAEAKSYLLRLNAPIVLALPVSALGSIPISVARLTLENTGAIVVLIVLACEACFAGLFGVLVSHMRIIF
jgi:hypothetical protein